MNENQCKYCKKSHNGEGDICNHCKLEGKQGTEKMINLVGTVETYAALRNMKNRSE